MSTKKLPNGKYRTSVYDTNGRRFRYTFANQTEAKAFVSRYEAEKGYNRLVSKKLKKPHYIIEDSLKNFVLEREGLRPKTLQKYNYFVKQFLAFCQGTGVQYIDDFTQDQAMLFRNILASEKKDPKGSTDRVLKPMPRTANYYLMKARSFFQSEVALGHIDKNPFINIKNMHVEKKPPEYYSKEEINKFFAQVMPWAYKDAFLVLLHSGIRFSELANLTWDDVDLSKRIIHIRPKDGFKTKTYNSIRSIPMNDILFKLFKNLSVIKKNDKYALSSVEGKKLRERSLYYWCQKYGKMVGIEGTISLHKFRHTFASHLVQNNVRIEIVQKYLGHSTIKETMIYAHIRPEEHHSEVNVLTKLFE